MAAEKSVLDEYPVFPTSSVLKFKDHWGHFAARWGWKRNEHRVRPGLYALGKPSPASPAFVTANYTLSFDALRSSLAGFDAYILVLNTFGINVWCAAGKGTFGTEELCERIETSGLSQFVSHRTITLPQLGATGIAAHEVKQRTGFKVEYGPVRAKDLPEYLKNHLASLEMRRVRFNILDRLVLIPIELKGVFLPTMAAAALAFLTGGVFMSLAVIGGVLTGTILFPLLLPYLPTKDYSTKGFVLGALYAVAVILLAKIWKQDMNLWLKIVRSTSHLLIWPALVGYMGLNFTGSTPFTSRTGVRKEIFTYTRLMAIAFILGILLNIVTGFLK